MTAVGYADTTQANYNYLHDAFIYAYATRGVLFFAAAGNYTEENFVIIPARFSEVVAVGALDRWGGSLIPADYTPNDPKIELVAGGGRYPPPLDLRISWNRLTDDAAPNEGTRLNSGTSFAAPVAAGVARLVMQKFPGFTASQLRMHLQTYARDLGVAGKDNIYGYGMVSAKCALLQLLPCTP